MAVRERPIPVVTQSVPEANRYSMFSNAAKPIPMQTAYTIPSIRSSKYGFFLRNIHRQKSLAVSSGMAAPKKAVRKASQKEWISVG